MKNNIEFIRSVLSLTSSGHLNWMQFDHSKYIAQYDNVGYQIVLRDGYSNELRCRTVCLSDTLNHFIGNVVYDDNSQNESSGEATLLLSQLLNKLHY